MKRRVRAMAAAGIAALTPDADANVKQWSQLPPLGDFNKTLDQKAGAVVLARKQIELGEDEVREAAGMRQLAFHADEHADYGIAAGDSPKGAAR